MALITKVATAGTTNLAATTAWDPAQVPTLADEAQWLTTSLGGTLSGAFSALQLIFNGATADVTHSSGTTITLGANGWVCAPTNNRSWNENGTIAVGSTNQTWAFAHSAQSSLLRLAGASSLTGTATIQFTNNSGNASNGYAYILATGACTGFTGTIALNDYTAIAANSTGALTTAKLEVNGTGCALYLAATNQTLGGASGLLTINNNVELGFAGRTFTIAYPIALGSTTRTLNFASQTTLTGAITGTAGFTKTGILFVTRNAGTTLSGTIIHTDGYTQFGSQTSNGDVFPNVTAIQVNSTGTADPLAIQTNTTINPISYSLSGTGGVQIFTATGTFVQFGTGALAALNSANTSNGLCVQPLSAGVTSTIKLKDLPAGKMSYLLQVSNQTGIFEFNGSTSTSSSPPIYINRQNAGLTGTSSVIAANGGAGASVTFGGILTCEGATNTATTHVFRGTNTANNTFAGVISQGNATSLSITKAEAGRWVLSGNNTYTGTTTISAGTLSAQGSSALGPNSTAVPAGGVITNTGGILELANNTNLDKSGCAIQQVSVAGATAFQVPDNGGDNTLQCAGITLNSNIQVYTGTSAALRFRNTGAMSGAFNVTKNGTGELDLGAALNNYTGTTTATAGTLTVGASCAPATAGPLGNSTSTVSVTGTFKYNGDAEGTITRDVHLLGNTPKVDSSGTAPVNMLNVIATGTTTASRTFTLTGTNTGNNVFAGACSDSATHATTVDKQGAGYWSLTGALNHGGGTSVQDGTLDLGSINRALLGEVRMSGGTLANGTSNTVSASSVVAQSGESTVRAPLAGTTSVTASGLFGGTLTLYPSNATGSSTHSGGTGAIQGGVLQLACDAVVSTPGNGRMAGAGNVDILEGTLKTANTPMQRGQARYAGNLTFGSGAKMYIGSASV